MEQLRRPVDAQKLRHMQALITALPSVTMVYFIGFIVFLSDNSSTRTVIRPVVWGLG